MNYVRFLYREQTQNGKFEVNEYSGYISRIYKNGWFILTDGQGREPARFEWMAVIK